MRDKSRIKRICKLIETEWLRVPDQRLGQFLANYVFGHHVDIFFQEDDMSETMLICTQNEKNNNKVVTSTKPKINRTNSPEKWYVYIVECKDGTLYTGTSNNVTRRIEDHNRGKGAKYIRGKRPVELRAFWEFDTRSKACIREYEIKQLGRVAKLELIKERTKEYFRYGK